MRASTVLGILYFHEALQYDLFNLSDEECARYVELHTNDGICTVDGFRLDPEHAITYVKNNLLIENVTVFIHISLESDDGFRIRTQP